jgi:sec-independent protein translocase protein TatB
MFEVGFTEVILIFGIALLVLGPARLPKLAADVGRWAGRARAMARQLRTQLEQETQFDPLADDKPATSTPSNTIHTPATTPAPSTAPVASSDTLSGTEGDESRAAPAQLATAAQTPVSTTAGPADEPFAPLNATPEAFAPPAKTDTDEPKPG